MSWLADGGHEWLVVPVSSCKGLPVSSYSYVDPVAGVAYLEGDCDAELWIRAFPDENVRDVRFDYVDGDAACRRLPRFGSVTL